MKKTTLSVTCITLMILSLFLVSCEIMDTAPKKKAVKKATPTATGGYGDAAPATGGYGDAAPAETGGYGDAAPATGGYGDAAPATGGYGDAAPAETGGYGAPASGGYK